MGIRITFANGSGLDAEVNGNCYITDTRPEFPDDLSVVTVAADDPCCDRTYRNAHLVECASSDGRYWFTFREPSSEELYRMQLDEERGMTLDLIADQEYRLCMIELGSD